MNEDEKLSEIADQLKRLRPAKAGMDASVLFYQAGFNACKSQVASHDRIRIAPLIAAGLLAAIVTAPASYRVGQTAALRAEPEMEGSVAAIDPASSESPTEEESPRLDSAPTINQPKTAVKSKLLARWIEPFGGFGALAESAKLDHELETTLAVYHSSLVTRQDSSRDWIDFPFSTTLARHATWGSPVSANGSESTSPLAVSDLQQLAQSLETTR